MKIKLGVRVGICNQEETIDIDKEESLAIAEMSKEEREEYLDKAIDSWLPNYMDCWASFVEE